MGVLQRKEPTWNGTERRASPAVLVVNDDADAVELLVRFLGQSGFATEGAGSETAALVKLTQHLPRCVVLDMQAGGVGASLKILDQIRTHKDHRISAARVLLCAASPNNRSFSFQSGADGFLVRPFHLDELVDQITAVINRPPEERARHRRDELARLP